MNKYEFPPNFLWGACTSGVQSEGATNKVNPCVWEEWFDERPDLFFGPFSNKIACDTYNKYEEDVQLMKEVGLNSFRTSIQWSRLIKDFETFEVDVDAVRFYTEYFSLIKKNNIHLVINLYHFDLPAELLEKHDGFESKHVVDLFLGYAKKAFELFDEYADAWVTMNEPIVPIEFGYFYKAHKPYIIDTQRGYQAGFNTILAHAKVVNYYHIKYQKEIGCILNITPVYARSDDPEDLLAAKYCDSIFNRSFADPIIKNTFDPLVKEIAKENGVVIDTEGVEEIETAKIDFVGLNYYLPRRAKKRESAYTNDLPIFEKYYESYIDSDMRVNPHRDNNEIYPEAIYDMAMDVKNSYGNIKWYLAEIGISITNEKALEVDGVIDDSFRTELFKEHMVQIHRAINDGSNCFGVHQWTFIDCWSWLNSFKRRYGLYSLDIETGERRIKKHGIEFKKIVTDNGFEY